MKQKKIIPLFLCIILFSCKKNDTTVSCNLSLFPTTVGNSWIYKQTIQINYDNLRDTVLYDTIHLEVIKDTIYDGKTMQKIECFSNKNPYKSFSLCINENSAFTQYMSEPGTISNVLRIKNLPFSNVNPLSNDNKILIPNYDIFTILKFDSSSWTYADNDNVKIEKKNVGEENITTSLSSFQCCKYEFNYLRKFFPQSIQITEYFSNKGLIKKIIDITNTEFTDNAGNFIDTGDSYNTIELIDYTIN